MRHWLYLGNKRTHCNGLMALGILLSASLVVLLSSLVNISPLVGAQFVGTGNSGQQLAGGGGGDINNGYNGSASIRHFWRRSTTTTTPTTTNNKDKKSKKKFVQDCLEAHNKYRRLHKVPDLKWDEKIVAFAQKRSDHIAASDGAEFGHPPGLPYGENLYWHSRVKTSCEFMVKGWYDEIKLYDFKSPSFEAATGHFTQVVWRSTKRVGCAVSISSGKRGGIYLTCNYDPAGNFLGEFPANVPRPASGGGTFSGNGQAIEPQIQSVSNGNSTAVSTEQTPLVTATNSLTSSGTTATPIAPITLSNDNSTSTSTTTKPKNKRKKNKKKKNKKKKNRNKKKKNNTTTTTTTTTTTLAPNAVSTTLDSATTTRQET